MNRQADSLCIRFQNVVSRWHLTSKSNGYLGCNSEMPFALFLLVSCGPAYFTIITSARYRTRQPFSRWPPKAGLSRLESVIWMCGSAAAIMPPALRISNGPFTFLYSFAVLSAVEVTWHAARERAHSICSGDSLAWSARTGCCLGLPKECCCS